MSQVIITQKALEGIERCRGFLASKNPLASQRAAHEIIYYFDLLMNNPETGRPFEDNINLRELIIPLGDSGYVALYRYDNIDDTVYILSFKHQKEVEYCISST